MTWLGRRRLAKTAELTTHCLTHWCDCCATRRTRVAVYTLTGNKVGQSCYRHSAAVMTWCVKKYPEGVYAEPVTKHQPEPVRID